MVRLLIRMRATMLGHTPTNRFGKLSILLTLLFSLALAVGTLLSGFARYPTPEDGLAVLGIASALWFFGRIGYTAFAGGDASLRWELFRLLPVTRARLARSLLVVGLLDPGGVIMAIALSAALPIGARAGIVATAIAVLGVLLSVVLINVLVTVVGALQPHSARRTRDTGTVVVAFVISLVAVAGTALTGLTAALAGGHARAIARQPAQTLAPLAGLVARPPS